MAGKAQNLVWMKPLSDLPVDTVVLLVDGAYLLAEGVVWCSRKQELWWVGKFSPYARAEFVATG